MFFLGMKATLTTGRFVGLTSRDFGLVALSQCWKIMKAYNIMLLFFLVNRDYAREAKKQPTDKNRKRP